MKKKKKKLKSPLLDIGLGGVAVLSIIIFFLVFSFSIQGSYAQPIPPTSTPSAGKVVQAPQNLINTTSPGLPIRLKIPKIKVDAAIERVGVTAQGVVGTPKIPRDAAWLSLGARPGEIGSAVIDGHVNWYNGATAVFANLSKLKPGDKIIIQDDKGKIISFVVRKVRTYGLTDDTSEVFAAEDDLSHLNLITCIGVWDKKAKQYNKRLVVFADRE